MAVLGRPTLIFAGVLFSLYDYAGSAKSAPVSKSVIAHLQCSLCKNACKEIRLYAREKDITGEEALMDEVEKMCNHSDNAGNWINHFDITPDGAPKEGPLLRLQKQDNMGFCNAECEVVEQVCAKVFKAKDDEIVSLLEAKAGAGKMQKSLCEKACKTKKFPKLEGWTDEPFLEDKRAKSDAATQKIMDFMKGQPGGENLKVYKPGDNPLHQEM
mmetsp:Transcript_135929/g.253989  ORF Transcript_135929/g.253989 Transcript_135929/m.253989 type:complete len:214 (-) Transcript_135929:78-719(-)